MSGESTIPGKDRPFAGTVINVEHYGADGDDAVDDTECLRKAIAASKRGDAIYFPRGRYLVSGPLIPKPEQMYFSVGDAAIIVAVPGSEPFSMFEIKAGAVEFHHLTFDLSKPEEIEAPENEPPPAILAQAPARGIVELVVSCCRIRHVHGQGIRVGGSGDPRRHDRVIIRDVLVEDCCESGLTLNRVNGARVETSRFVSCRNGIQVASSRDVVVHAVAATDNRRHGIAFRFSHDWHVDNCVAKSNGGDETDREKLRGWGIAAGGGPEKPTPVPNSDFTITNNICEDNYAGGITLDPTVADDPKTRQDESALIWEQRARISGNVCRGRKGGKPLGGEHPRGTHGIQVRNSSDVVVTDNLCHHNNNSGIAVVNSRHVLVQSNACFQNTNGIGIFHRADLKDSGRHLIGLNMLHDNDEDDLKGMQ